MRARIAVHQARRNADWLTVEAPTALAHAITENPTRPVLVDCMTLWLTNLMLCGRDIAAASKELDIVLDRRRAPIILVSNEVGLGLVPETQLGRAFRDAAGALNQRLACKSDRVVFMVAGLPINVK
jgi:adenosyl cobinamide kinase/adenosyl cobinamide phosphate guanylyltransferase